MTATSAIGTNPSGRQRRDDQTLISTEVAGFTRRLPREPPIARPRYSVDGATYRRSSIRPGRTEVAGLFLARPSSCRTTTSSRPRRDRVRHSVPDVVGAIWRSPVGSRCRMERDSLSNCEFIERIRPWMKSMGR